MKSIAALLSALAIALALAGCAGAPRHTPPREQGGLSAAGSRSGAVPGTPAKSTAASEKEEGPVEDKGLQMRIGGTAVAVAWEENASVDALRALAEQEPLTVEMSMYGGFEQVGALGAALPQNDVQTTTQAGDIVLYSGDQIVVFYGANSWAYTRLGHITDKTADEMAVLLGSGDVTVTLSLPG